MKAAVSPLCPDARSTWWHLAAFLPVVIPAGQDDKKLTIQPVNQAMFLFDAARPAAGQVFPQGLGFADAIEGITQASLDQLVDASQLPAVLALPVDDDGIKDSRRPYILCSLVYPALVQPMSGPVHHIVGADVDRNELLSSINTSSVMR